MAPTRALGYVRLSRETEASTSPERQRKDITALVQSRGWELVDIVEDIDVSATRKRLDRPGIHELRRRIAAREAEYVVVSRLDRLARSVADTSQLLDDGLKIVSATEAFDASTASGVMMVQLTQVFAEMEARMIGERVRSMRKHLPHVGRWPGGPPPYGFTTAPHPDSAGRTLEHHPDESKVVRRMVAEILAGTSVTQVARSLTEDGIPSRRGSYWSRSTVARTLRHGSLRGWATVSGDLVRDDRGLPTVMWPPLIDEDEAQALALAMTRRAPEQRLPDNGRVPLLQGLALCASCMYPLTPRHFAHPTRDALYVCQSRNRGRICEAPQTVTAANAEKEAAEQFLDVWADVEIVETTSEEVHPAELSKVLEALAQTHAAFGKPGADHGPLAERMAALDKERERLSASTTAKVQRRTGVTYGERWSAASVAERRDIMRGAGAFVTVNPAAARGHWNPERIVVSDELAGQLDD